jgi:restriction system protein
MPIPDYQTLMLPLLISLKDGKEHNVRELIKFLSNQFELSEEERNELLPSGKQPIIDNRIGWARTYMKKAGLLEDPKRGYVKITDKGLEVLEQNPDIINIKFLGKFPKFVEFRAIKKEKTQAIKQDIEETDERTPDELMEKGSNMINSNLIEELLIKLREIDPYFFEHVVGNLLSSMGYGEFKITKRSGDKGIDGIVNQDKLGIDRIFFQAKRYGENNSVTAHDVRDFVGTLDLNGVNKGIFITTSKFPNDTEEIISKTPKNIILINGIKLAKLMIEYNVGVSNTKTYNVKKIDTDFFVEE